MSEKNNYVAGFFKRGNTIKCSIDGYNKDRIIEALKGLSEGDELVLFERTEEAKRKSSEERGTPIEKQPTHNLTRVPAEEVQRRRDEWKATRKGL